MPKLWEDSIEAHRHAVRTAVVDAVGALVAEEGLGSVTMAQVARRAGIGRATLYKHFDDLESVLLAWHERHIAEHLRRLAQVAEDVEEPSEKLRVVLETFASLTHHSEDGDLSAVLHRGDHMRDAHHQLLTFVRDLIADAAAAGAIRSDVPPEELALYCLHAIGAAGALPTKGLGHLIEVIMAGLTADSRTDRVN